MTDHTPYTVPKEPGGIRAAVLAIAVHLALLVFFWIGIDWQSETPVAIKAEIWDMQAREAAPVAPEPEPVTQPKPEPEPKPEVKEEVKPDPEPPQPKVDIALEQEKKRKEEERKQKLAQQEKEKKEKLEKEKAEAERKKLAEEKKKEEQKKAEAEKKKLEQQKAEAEKKRKQQEAADQKRRDQARAEEMRRLTGAIGSGGTGQAEKSTGSGRADASYLQKIGARIRSNTTFNVPEGLAGNPAAEFDVELLPDGSLRGVRLRKSSGLPGFDDAVKRAIERSQPFPADNSGKVPGRFTVIHKPKDQ